MFIRVEILLQLSITFVTQLLIIKILDLYNKISNPRQTQGHAFGKKTSRAGLYALNTRRRHAPATVDGGRNTFGLCAYNSLQDKKSADSLPALF